LDLDKLSIAGNGIDPVAPKPNLLATTGCRAVTPF
jgi:hypothetical protein